MLTTSRTPLSYLFDCLLLLDTEWRKAKIRQHYTVLRYEEQVYLETERTCVRDVVKALRQLEKEVAQSVLTLRGICSIEQGRGRRGPGSAQVEGGGALLDEPV